MRFRSYNTQGNHSFCNNMWRALISNICAKIDKNNAGIRAISPFGFELLENKAFLSKSIRRLYCYIGIPKDNIGNQSVFNISKMFSELLMSSINIIGLSPSEIAILVAQNEFTFFHENNYQCKHSDKLIDVQTRIVNSDILTDYADYIICSIDSICSEKDEPKHFHENKRHRCRTYQLYIMLEKIFGYLLPSLSALQTMYFHGIFQFIDNTIQMFYTLSALNIPASTYETDLFNVLIKPRVELMRHHIQLSSSNEELIKIQCDAYHVEGKLELILNRNIYKSAVDKIKTTYLSFSN